MIPADNNDNKNDLAERRLMTMTAIFDFSSILGKLRRRANLQVLTDCAGDDAMEYMLRPHQKPTGNATVVGVAFVNGYVYIKSGPDRLSEQ